MPKRKSENKTDHIEKKIKRLERKLRHRSRHGERRRRRHRHRSYSSTEEGESSSISRDSQRSMSYDQQDEIVGYVDLDDPTLELDPIPSTSRAEDPVFIPSVAVIPPKDNDIAIVPSHASPETSAPTTQCVPDAPEQPPTAAQPPAVPGTEADLDNELLDILGTDPTIEKKYSKDLQKDLSIRFQHWTTKGLTKELRKELKENYLTPDNCKLIDPPELNDEIRQAISDVVLKRDKAIEGKQKQLSSAISCLGEAITRVLSSKEKDTELLKLLMDSARLLCDCQHADTLTRRTFLISAVKTDMKDHIKNTQIDRFIFGENLNDKLKSAKAINKTGNDLKPPTPKMQNKKPVANTATSSRNLNWRNPGQVRRQMGPPRMKEPAMTSTRSRPPASWKQSQYPQRTSHRRH